MPNQNQIGQRERATQNRVVQLFQTELGYTYLGDWQTRPNNSHIEQDILRQWLTGRGISQTLINKALYELEKAATISGSTTLYAANQAVYRLLRYGIKVKEGAGEQNQTIWLIDWKTLSANQFAIAEEVTIKGANNKRPDIVLYINGIALGVLELKRASVSIGDGIRQNLDNQKKEFIQPFFATMQWVMAGNDTQGLRYGTIETPEKYYLEWREENPDYNPKQPKGDRYLPNAPCATSNNLLDCAITYLLNKERFLELLHDFVVFDTGIKKIPRHNQYHGVKAAQKRLAQQEGGIIWHTQGSGKSLTMVWLARWIRENLPQSRILILTDRTELDEQIEGVFHGVGETIYRTQNGADMLRVLDDNKQAIICSLVHKFRSQAEADITDDFIKELQNNLTSHFSPKGDLYVFVDECHRTHSGKLHQAMKKILPHALFIGFTGTPLLKKDKKKSVEVFGSFIHDYRFDQAVSDGVVLDLRYEARDIDQRLDDHDDVDKWFENKTKGLTDMAKVRLKQKWGTMQKVLSSRDRLRRIVRDIQMDMDTKPRLSDGRGNAMLVCSSIYEACKVYELFQETPLADKCAIITSYKPSPADIKGEESGAGLTEKLKQYSIYRKMLASFFNEPEDTAMGKTESFEKLVKQRFIKEPGQMRLLIVVDKLLTGFDAPSATYLYIDKKMRDHGLFQAICRVNRLDGESKEYGYIVDYQDLFHSLEGAIQDYTSGAFDQYDKADIAGLLSNRLQKERERLEAKRESVKAICEAVAPPQDQAAYFAYFSATDNAKIETIHANEGKRVALYKAVANLIRAYASIANELPEAGYAPSDIQQIKQEVTFYEKMRREIEIHSGDYIDLKQYEADMRYMIDEYITAKSSKLVVDFEELGLVELFVKNAEQTFESLPEGIRQNEEQVAETIENNLRRIIADEREINPKYYDEMSALLDQLIKERKSNASSYKVYLQNFKELATQVTQADTRTGYPDTINTEGKQALYDLLQDEHTTRLIDQTIYATKKHAWVGNQTKENEVAGAIYHAINATSREQVMEIMALVKNQNEYQ